MKRREKKLRQKQFVDHWNVGDHLRNYDALEDYYASSYFASPKVKKHLKHFSKAAKKQPKTTDLLRMTQLLDQRYQWRQKKSIRKRNQLSVTQSLKYSESDNTFEKKPQINHSNQKNRQNNSIIEQNGQKLPQLRAPKSSRSYKSTDRQQKLVPVQKKKYLQYIQKKKQQLNKERYKINKQEIFQ